MRKAHAILAVVVAATLSTLAAGCGAGSPATVGASAPASSSPPATSSPAPGATIAWVGRFAAADERSVDPRNGYGSPLTLKLPVSILKISRRGDRYVGVIATPSLPSLPANTLVFRPASRAADSLLATPAPLTRIVLHALSPDSFSYVCRVRAGGVWTLFSTMTFRRVGSQT